MENRIYDTAIIGGGLAGLALSIQLANKGYSVLLLEKERYPFHKVCGEYISNESKGFLKTLGVPVDEMHLPSIRRVNITAVNGSWVEARLPLGGFGISRYTLDHVLSNLAKKAGVILLEKSKAEDISFDGKLFSVTFNREGSQNIVVAKTCCGSFGKRSNIDVKWDREFLKKQDRKLDNHIGVKYHIETNWSEDLIGLHNFRNGYCGISKIEGNKYCLCYMTKAEDVKQFGGDLKSYERSVLCANPFLYSIFNQSHFLPGFPVTIAQINFQQKTPVENNVLLLGDAAGMITPLCGNGMSMAMHSAKVAAGLVEKFLKGEIGYRQLTETYSKEWNSLFSRRMRMGRLLQRFFGKTSRSNRFVALMKMFPVFKRPLIRLTHGKPF